MSILGEWVYHRMAKQHPSVWKIKHTHGCEVTLIRHHSVISQDNRLMQELEYSNFTAKALVWPQSCDDMPTKKHLPHFWPFLERIRCEGNPAATKGFSSQRVSNTELWCFLCYQPEQAVKQTVKLMVIWDTMLLMWCQSNDHPADNCDWPTTCRSVSADPTQSSSWVADDMRHHNAHVDGLVLERRNSIADALELRLSCTNPSMWRHSNDHPVDKLTPDLQQFCGHQINISRLNPIFFHPGSRNKMYNVPSQPTRGCCNLGYPSKIMLDSNFMVLHLPVTFFSVP